MSRRESGARFFEQNEPIEVLGASLERQAVNLDEVFTIGGDFEIEQAVTAIGQQVAPLGIGDDQHRA